MTHGRYVTAECINVKIGLNNLLLMGSTPHTDHDYYQRHYPAVRRHEDQD